jgi:hypothetical protein
MASTSWKCSASATGMNAAWSPLSRRIKPLPATFKEVYKQANEFSLNNAEPDSFKTGAEAKGLQFMNVDELRNDQRFVPACRTPSP